MIKIISNILNTTTMYRLILYFLLLLFGYAIVLSAIGILPYSATQILLQGLYLGVICNIFNIIIGKLFGAQPNLESTSITALILTLIVGPFGFTSNIINLTIVALIAITSKYLLAINRKHIFNPAAIAVLLAGFFFNYGASWWIGSIYTLPIIITGGLFVLSKIKRFTLAISFLALYIIGYLFTNQTLPNTVVPTIIWFFIFVMLIEPLTAPTSKRMQAAFGGIVAASYYLIPQIFSQFPYALESSLLVGNLFAFVIAPSYNLKLEFVSKTQVAKDTWAFYFKPDQKFKFKPGQYMEWTLPHFPFDTRGYRRYFTIASSPTEDLVMTAMRIPKNSSTFKKSLLSMETGFQMTSLNPQGEFVLPSDKNIPLVFAAGGIGITPFLSMIRYLIDTKTKRDIVLIYANNDNSEAAFRKLLDEGKKVGIKAIYIESSKTGFIDEELIKSEITDYQKRMFYISGPSKFVNSIKEIAKRLGIKNIKTDFFPGY